MIGGMRYLRVFASAWLLLACAIGGVAQADSPSQTKSVLPLYRALRTVRLDPARVYRIREASIDRDDLHIFFNDGIVVFTREVEGRITGMYFEGDGEILVRPPNRTEKESLGVFTKLGLLESRFKRAYFRFNEDVLSELQPSLRPPGDFDASEVTQVDAAAERLADVDALRLLSSFTSDTATDSKGRKLISDHFLHGRIGGTSFGTYDVFYDTRNPEQIAVGQSSETHGAVFYDLWMSFKSRRVREGKADGVAPLRAADSVHIDNFKIDVAIHPPTNISATADLDIEVRQGGQRLLFFELSHSLKLKSLTQDGAPLEYLQNEAIEGSQLARRGNDFVVVVLPAPCKAGDRMHLRFVYEGSVLADAGNGLLYVGEHGTWYPNRGLTPSNYDLTFAFPSAWNLVSIGKKVSQTTSNELTTSHWVSDRPVPVGGFNLGHYTEALDAEGPTEIAAYASHSVEKDFPTPQGQIVARRSSPWTGSTLTEVNVPLDLNPAASTKAIAREGARTVGFYNTMLGPYPFSALRLTQFPGAESQGWPGLIYLSSYTFLTNEQRQQLGMTPFVQDFFGTLMLRHEIAHMWWGHEVFWDSYRDQWLSEALANYSAMMMTERDQPEKFRILMEGYRTQLITKRPGGQIYEAGPVTLGARLNSAKFPDAYQSVVYGRGAWLVHMLRCMLEDGTRASREKSKSSGDDLFLQVLRTLLRRHRDSGMSTDDFRRAFEEVLPDSLRFEGRKSLDWFFDGWVNGTAIPTIDVSTVKFSKQNEQQFVSGVIRQHDAPYDLVTSVPVYAQEGEKLDYLGRVFAVGEETRFRLRTRGAARKIVIDPFHTILTRPKS